MSEVRRFRQRRDVGARHGQRIPWREDPVILERLALETPLFARGWSQRRILERVNEWALERGYPTLGLTTIGDDHKRLIEWKKDELEEARARQLMILQEIRTTAFADHEEEAPGSSERSSLLNVAEKAVQDEAKITGTMVHVIRQEHSNSNDDTARILFAVLTEMVGEAMADRIAAEVERRLLPTEDTKLITAKVITADN